MTKKDFELIARVLANTNAHRAVDPTFAEGWHAAISAARERFADELAITNDRFDREVFIKASLGR